MSTDRPLAGQVALITGGARGIGRAVALALARAGMDIALTFHKSTVGMHEVVAAVREVGCEAHAIPADLSDQHAVSEIMRRFNARFDRLDVLVNNASLFSPSALSALIPEAFDRMMQVNARAPLMLIQACTPLLGARYRPEDRASAGRIVNFVDIHVLGEPLQGFVAYNASKAALMEITVTCAVELAPRITVNAVAPGAVSWPEFYGDAERAALEQRIPLQRRGTPEECAAAVVFLVRDASYCTGQIIRVDGGRFLA